MRSLALLLPASLLLAACGSNEERARAEGRARFEQTRQMYERRFAALTATAPTGTAGPAGGATSTPVPVAAGAPASAPPAAASDPRLSPGQAAAALASPLPSPPAGGDAEPTSSSLAARSGPVAPVARDAAGAASAAGRTTEPAAQDRDHGAHRGTGGETGGESSVLAASAPAGAPAGAPATTATPASASPTPASSPLPSPTPDASGSSTPAPSASPSPRPSEPPGSDAEPPKVTAIEFLPAQIQDGNRVKIRAAVSDNLSGTDSASGTLTGPSAKARVYFDLAPDAASGTLTGDVKIPPSAEAGAWIIATLTLRDKAHNIAVLTPATSPALAAAQLTVLSANADTTPPNLLSIQLSPPQVQDGGSVRLFVQASDDKSAVTAVKGTLASPSRSTQVDFSAYLNPATNLFEATLAIPAHAEAGTWSVQQLRLTDAARNQARLTASDPLLATAKVTVQTASADQTPPQLVALQLAPTRVQPGNQIDIDASASDDLSGVKSAQGVLLNAQRTAPLPFTLEPTPGVSGQFHVRVTVPPNAAHGKWHVESLLLFDAAGNKASLTPADPLLASATFDVSP